MQQALGCAGNGPCWSRATYVDALPHVALQVNASAEQLVQDNLYTIHKLGGKKTESNKSAIALVCYQNGKFCPAHTNSRDQMGHFFRAGGVLAKVDVRNRSAGDVRNRTGVLPGAKTRPNIPLTTQVPFLEQRMVVCPETFSTMPLRTDIIVNQKEKRTRDELPRGPGS